MSDKVTLDARITRHLQAQLDGSVALTARVRGGDSHQAFRVQLGDSRRVFVKTNPTPRPGLFSAEAEGLKWLAGFGSVRTPEVLSFHDGSGDVPGYLALAWVPSAAPDDDAFARLGAQLAELHSHGQAAPGWRRASYIGPLPQLNGGEALSWSDFWAERRLRPMLEQAARALPADTVRAVESVADQCDTLVGPGRPLCPLHGDLWTGNVLFHAGTPVLVDPAVYVGDAEVDLAMMALFGGFGPAFWRAYHAELRPEPGWRRRRHVYQLWPLLVHAALFGGGYAERVAAAARSALSDASD